MAGKARVRATALLATALVLLTHGAAAGFAALKESAVHDPVAAMQGLITRRLGAEYIVQVRSLLNER